MNLVRLSFIASMAGLSAYSLYSAVTRPYVAPITVLTTKTVECTSGGGYYNEWFFILAAAAIAAALAVACADLARRVY